MDLNMIKQIPYSSSNSDCHKPSVQDIAIIGLHAKVGKANNVKEFWDYICNGMDLITDFPQQRYQDAVRSYQHMYQKELPERLGQSAYMEQVDLFDPSVFNISPREAELMDPAQRMFLESAWTALEDAGYGGGCIKGSPTGVFLGYTSPPDSYRSLLKGSDANTYGISVSGNVDAIIASRISYILNLKGPAVNIDTTCSSSLVAVHMACEQIKNGSITMAIAGSVRFKITPSPEVIEKKMGIESSSSRTKTFNYDADGTGTGEGVICFILKSLSSAVRDRDNIYAVIKGGSVNQDGASIGITAPNAEAQESVIRDAWKDARINPETISYFEAHGTATKLGDPVEINGIERAFSRVTDKKQFCAIGSVKSNVGHLDSAAGAVGLLKAVLMLKHKQLPPTLHFKAPNQQINFSSSPVYVNDRLCDWEPTDYPRRCGVSSFGMSGTNCHVILEEAPKIDHVIHSSKQSRIFTISAQDEQTVRSYIDSYKQYLMQMPNCNLDDLCYTANIGRAHFGCRFAMILRSPDDLFAINLTQPSNDNRYVYGEHKITDSDMKDGYIHRNTVQLLSQRAAEITQQIIHESDGEQYKDLLNELIALYVQGANIDWEQLYVREERRKLSIPTYPFNHKRYWISLPSRQEEVRESPNVNLHPLVHTCVVDTHRMQVYMTRMNVEQCWELKCHMINGVHVLPGTVFFEMAVFVSNQYLKHAQFDIENLLYLVPFACGRNETRTIHTIIQEENDVITVNCFSKNDKEMEWIHHLEVSVRSRKHAPAKNMSIDIPSIMARCEVMDKHTSLIPRSIVEIKGNKWNNLSGVYKNDKELLLSFSVDKNLLTEFGEYILFPSLLDPAINSGNLIINDVYLPFSCEKARFYQPLPPRMFSYIKLKEQDRVTDEFAAFDVTLLDEDGHIIGELNNYVIKKIHDEKNFMMSQHHYRTTHWIACPTPSDRRVNALKEDDSILIMYRRGQLDSSLMLKMRQYFKERVIAVELSEACDFDTILSSLAKENIKYIVNMASLIHEELQTVSQLKTEMELLFKSTFNLIKELLNQDVRHSINLVVFTSNATKVTGEEEWIQPLGYGLGGMVNSIGREYANIKTRVIDIDNDTQADVLIEEMLSNESLHAVSYRKNVKYMQQINDVTHGTSSDNEKMTLVDNGVYIITGGLGGMGLSISKYLFNINPNIHVVLFNRTYSRDTFSLLSEPVNPILRKKLEQVQGLWSKGYSLDIMQADITDYTQMDDALQQLRNAHGVIRGVIHAAGIAGDGFIMNKTWETYESVLRPKISGSWILHELTREDPLSFFVMCSSYISVFGSAGQSDYVAANAFLDSFSYYRRAIGLPSLTINWTGWSESGMAVVNGIREDGVYARFLNDEEGATAFWHALNTKLPQVLIGDIDYRALEMEQDKLIISLLEVSSNHRGNYKTQWSKETNPEDKEIVVIGKSMSELTDIERNVIYAWSQTLGNDQVDIYAKFFESGGNSLLAAYLQKELDKFYPDIIVITDMFVYSTVVEIAQYIESKTMKKNDKITVKKESSKNIKDMLDQFVAGDMNMEQVLALLDKQD
ncbi:beta-ketoacyl synthase N-terminal-like domain-containing protein [Paenibacillus amylolyticus]|uniref:beta-ketoacyl synthase N-terminal-like domain-containing protein n=1 Tax=Paenibacillus amylolyticus TaxID=1451 RepID=UPI003D2BDA59